MVYEAADRLREVKVSQGFDQEALVDPIKSGFDV